MHAIHGRIIRPEILDTLPPEQARRSLGDLVRLNRHFGGHGVMRKILAQVAKPGDAFTLLDVGAASGDSGDCVRAWYPNASVTSLDYLESHLAKAKPPKLAADAFRLPFAPESFDFVSCSLFLHHFSNQRIVELLRGFAVVARKAVLVNDLERHPLAYYFLPATKWILGWDGVTVNDGPISVEAGFHRNEMEGLLRSAGFLEPLVTVYRPSFRIAVIARKQSQS